MIDFKINNSGDIVLNEQEKLSKFRVDFRISEYKGLLLKIFQRNQLEEMKNKNFKITFNTKAHFDEITYKTNVIKDIEEVAQRVLIQLRTELTELPNRQMIGSKLRTMKHKRLHSAANISNIESIVLEAIQNIIENPTVIAKSELGTGTFYCQNINIYIYSNNKLFYKFSL